MRFPTAIDPAAFLACLILLGSCSSSENPAEPEPDTTPPVVVMMQPAPGSHEVHPRSEVLIGFSKAMDPESAPGHVTFSHGSATDFLWHGENTLGVAHEVWPMGTRITVVVDGGFQDLSGLQLAESASWEFLTDAPGVILLDSAPRDGDRDVPPDTGIRLLFSKPMEPETLPDAITVTSDRPFPHVHSLSGALDTWDLAFAEDLPPDTEITVNISTAAADTSGNPLFNAAAFGFRTAPRDTIPSPRIVDLVPEPETLDVALDAPLTILFDRDMAESSAAGNITLSHGEVTDLLWEDPRTLTVSHGGWPAGSEVSVTVGAGLESAEGHPLGEPVSWRFFTLTEEVVVLSTFPPDGAADILVTAQIHVLFSKPMDGSTLPGAISVTSPGPVDHPFEVDGSGQSWQLTFSDKLPESTLITVLVDTTAWDADGNPLSDPTSFSFATGTEADTTPPQVVSMQPATGSSIDPQTSTVRITFSEPVDGSSLQVSLVSGQLWLAFADQMNPVGWSDNNRVMTVHLKTPLSPGTVLGLVIGSFADINGNVNTDGFAWEVTATGAPDFYPVLDGWMFMYGGTWEKVEPEAAAGDLTRFEKVEVISGDDFLRWIDERSEKNVPSSKDIIWSMYDRYRRGVWFLEQHGMLTDDGMELNFIPSINVLPRPVTTGTWEGASDSPNHPLGDLVIEYEGEVLPGTHDLTGPDWEDEGRLRLHWLRCRKVLMDFLVSAEGQPIHVRSDTLWYAPGIGLVGRSYELVDDEGTLVSSYSLGWAGPQGEGLAGR